MLDMGFKPAVDRIVELIPKQGRQTLFFSATLEGAAGKLAAAYTRNPRRHVHAPAAENRSEVEHRFRHLVHEAKLDALVGELRDSERGRTLVFVRTKRGADRLVKKLSRHKLEALAMHGNKSQSQRRRALASFEDGNCDTLVATDVAARGIDVGGDHPRDQLRRPRGPRHLRAPHGPDRPRGRLRGRRQLRAARPAPARWPRSPAISACTASSASSPATAGTALRAAARAAEAAGRATAGAAGARGPRSRRVGTL